jgi:hypothetical protein
MRSVVSYPNADHIPLCHLGGEKILLCHRGDCSVHGVCPVWHVSDPSGKWPMTFLLSPDLWGYQTNTYKKMQFNDKCFIVSMAISVEK